MAPDEQSLVQRRPFGGYVVGTGLAQACSGSKSEDIGGVSLPVVRPVLGFKPKITLIGPLDSTVPEQLSDDALATLRESLSKCGPERRGGRDGRVSVGVDMTAKRLTIQVEDNGVGIDPQVTPGGRTDFGPDPVDRRPLIRPNPPLPQLEQQPGRGG